MPPLTFEDIRRAIIASLSPELLEKKYAATLTPDDPVETGHCAVASEAFYHLAGGKAAGFVPAVCSYALRPDGSMAFGAEKQSLLEKGARRETHWWVRGPRGASAGAGEIFDVTVRQYPDAFPYAEGHNTGFMQPQRKPSKRAQIVIDRVRKKLDDNALERYREACVESFQTLCARPPAPQQKRVSKSSRCSNS